MDGIFGSRRGHDSGHVRISFAPAERRSRDRIFHFPEFEGRGFATEMARHLIQVVQDNEAETRIFAFTLPEKNASNRILQKLGFNFVAKGATKMDLSSGGGNYRRQ
jgi:RimJ/RimL family protein N-acetyltransferase